ncbi:hypothetical protein ACFLZL_05000 [Thermodesulfobacteriota bacterium]
MASQENLYIAKGSEPVRQEELSNILNRHLDSFWQRLLPFTHKNHIRINDILFVLHPFWFVKVKTYADRIPFPPKIRYFCIYVDAATGECGLTDRMPEFEKKESSEQELRPVTVKEGDLKGITDDLLESLILRRYLLKRPKIEIDRQKMICLPYYYVQATKKDRTNCSFVVNGLSGEIKRK